MAISEVGSAESHAGTTGHSGAASFNFDIVAGAGCKGVVVFVLTISATKTVTSVTCATSAMTEITAAAAIDNATEPGRWDTFFLAGGNAAGSGTKNIVVNRTNNAVVMYAVAVAIGAAGTPEIHTPSITVQQNDGTIAQAAITDGSPGSNSLRLAAGYTGAANPPTAGADSTLLQSIDFGAFGAAVAKETTPGQGSRNVGLVAGSDDRAYVLFAVREAHIDAATAVLDIRPITTYEYGPPVPVVLPIDSQWTAVADGTPLSYFLTEPDLSYIQGSPVIDDSGGESVVQFSFGDTAEWQKLDVTAAVDRRMVVQAVLRHPFTGGNDVNEFLNVFGATWPTVDYEVFVGLEWIPATSDVRLYFFCTNGGAPQYSPIAIPPDTYFMVQLGLDLFSGNVTLEYYSDTDNPGSPKTTAPDFSLMMHEAELEAWGSVGMLAFGRNGGDDAGTIVFRTIHAFVQEARIDSATVALKLIPSGVDEYLPAGSGTEYTDSGTAVLALTPSATELREISDAATALITLTPSAIEIPSRGFVREVGRAQTTTADADLVITVADRPVPVNNRVAVIVHGRADLASPPSSVVDSRGNTYNLDREATYAAPTPDVELRVYSAHVTTQLEIGDTITVTYGATTSPWGILAIELAGVYYANPVDVAASSNGFSNTYNSGNAVTAKADDFLLGVATVRQNTTGFNIRQQSGWNEIAEQFVNAGNGNRLHVQCRIVDATGTYNSAPFRDDEDDGTINTGSLDFASAIVAYKLGVGELYADAATVSLTLTPSAVDIAQYVEQTEVIVKGIGAYTAVDGGNFTPPLPAGYTPAEHDILEVAFKQKVAPASLSFPAGWTRKLMASELDVDQIWWKRLSAADISGGVTAPLVTRSGGGSTSARLVVYEGCVREGDPYGLVSSVDTTSPHGSAGIPAMPGSLILFHYFGADNFDLATISGDSLDWTIRHGNASNPSQTELGTDTMIALATARKQLASSIGDITHTNSTGSALYRTYVLALTPAYIVGVGPVVGLKLTPSGVDEYTPGTAGTEYTDSATVHLNLTVAPVLVTYATLLVVADATALTAGDLVLKNALEGVGHVVTLISDETAENITGQLGVVISESCSSATLGSKYSDVAIPVICFEDSAWDDFGFTTQTAGGTTTRSDWPVFSPSHPIINGPFGDYSAFSTIEMLETAVSNGMKVMGQTFAPQLTHIARATSNAVLCAVMELGVLKQPSGVTPARRVAMGIRDLGMPSLTADGYNIVRNAIHWAIGTSIETVQFADTETVSLILTPSGVDEYTPVGGTEFTDSATALITLTPSALEERISEDTATVVLALTPSATEERVSEDAATVLITLTPSTSELQEAADTGTVLLTFTPSAAEQKVTSFVVDSFTDTDGVALENHTGEIGATWTQHPTLTGSTRQYEIRSNRIAAENVNNTKAYYASGVPTSADYEVDGQLRFFSFVDGAYLSIVARYDTTDDTGYQLRYDSQNTRWEIRKILAGATSSLGTWSESLSVGDVRTITLKVQGTTIKAFVNGVERISITDSDVTAAGRVGVRSAGVGSATTGHHLEYITGQPLTAEIADAATVVLFLTPSTVELQGTVDADTVVLSLVASATEFREITDAETALLILTPSALEERQRYDADTALLDLQASSSDVATLVDSGTVNLRYVPSGDELREISDAATSTLTLTPSTVEVAEFVDSDTALFKFTPSGVDDYTTGGVTTDSATAVVVLTPSTAEVAEFVDAATAQLVFTVTALEERQRYDVATALLVLTPSATEDFTAGGTGYVDSDTATIRYTPSGSDQIDAIEAEQVRYSLTPSATETTSYVDDSLVSLQFTVSTVSVSEFSDSTTTRLSLTPSAVTVSTFFDEATALVQLTASATEETQFNYVDTGTAIIRFAPIAVRTQIGVTTRYYLRWSTGESFLRWNSQRVYERYMAHA